MGFEPTRARALPVFKSAAARNTDRLGPTTVGSTELRGSDEPIADDPYRLTFTDERRTILSRT